MSDSSTEHSTVQKRILEYASQIGLPNESAA
jgi:hypothetical protein